MGGVDVVVNKTGALQRPACVEEGGGDEQAEGEELGRVRLRMKKDGRFEGDGKEGSRDPMASRQPRACWKASSCESSASFECWISCLREQHARSITRYT